MKARSDNCQRTLVLWVLQQNGAFDFVDEPVCDPSLCSDMSVLMLHCFKSSSKLLHPLAIHTQVRIPHSRR